MAIDHDVVRLVSLWFAGNHDRALRAEGMSTVPLQRDEFMPV